MTPSLEAEISLVACVLVDPHIAEEWLAAIDPQDLATATHRHIYRAVQACVDDGSLPDIVSVTEALHYQDRLEDAGGASYLSRLLDIVPTAVNFPSYAKSVRQSALLRRLRAAAEQIVRATENPEGVPAQAILETGASAILDLMATTEGSGPKHVSEYQLEAWRILEEKAKHRGVVGVRSGIGLLDWHWGGFQPGRLYVVAGRPSQGKSALAGQAAAHAALNGVPTLFASLEMEATELVERVWAQQSQVGLRAGIPEDGHARVAGAARDMAQAPLWIDDCGSGLSIPELRARVRSLVARQKLGLVVVDYLQLMTGDRRGNREQEVSSLSRGLKQLARSAGVPVVALSQLRRGSDDGGTVRKPTLRDLRESGAIEQDADGVLLLHVLDKEPEELDRWQMLGIIAKARGGPTGVVRMEFERATTTFRGVER